MACFLVPMGEAIVTTVVQKAVAGREKKAKTEQTAHTGISWSRKLGWLNKMLWGGTALLALEHVWHGEVVPWPPFLTAMQNPGEVGPMLREVATVGVAMAVAVTLVWGIIVLIADQKAKGVLDAKAASAKGVE
jgi:hypothetical protein